MNILARLGLFLACLGLPALLPAQFVDKAQRAGVDLNYPAAAVAYSSTVPDPYSVGGASCACDIDGDGWTDLIVARPEAPCLVFINNHDGTFREESHLRGLDTVSDIGGIAAGDLSNKGSADIVMTPIAGSRYYLFINDGTGHFREAAVERGADATVTQELHKGQSISLVDYDRDGYLDIYTCEWLVPSNGENALHSVLLHNLGRRGPGFFENKTAFAGLTQPVNYTQSSGYCGIWADFDGDGYPDLMLSADYGRSQLWWNNGDGTFSDGTDSSGIANSADAMGATLLDYDGDGKIDIFITAISPSTPGPTQGFVSDNKLFRNLGGRRFQEVSRVAGVKESGWGWGAQALDANNDGWPDLIATNGYVSPTNQYASAKTDVTKLFLNRTNGSFVDAGDLYGIYDNGLGRSVSILDYDNDGREDIFITQTIGHRILYHNEFPAANAHWLNLRFVGTTSNRDGYGAEVTITAGGRSQVSVYNPTNAYIGQREPRLHFGLGANTSVSSIHVKWPSGTVQDYAGVSADQTLTLTEGVVTAAAPTILTQPANVSAAKDSRVTLSVSGQGFPAPIYVWYKNGGKISGQNGSTLTINRVQPVDAGVYTVDVINQYGTATSRGATVTVTADLPSKSVARWWNEALLDGIRKDTPDPPVHARNLYHVSAALWDSFWAYERNGWTGRQEAYVREMPSLPADEASRVAAQQEAMSYAAYTVIKARFAFSPGNTATIEGIRWLMQRFGYDPDKTDDTGSSPSATGLRIGRGVLSATLNDGANEAHSYVDATGYTPANPPLKVRNAGVGSNVNPDRWQPLDLVNTVTQNGITLGASIQKFVGSNAINTRTFALTRAANGFLVDDPGPPPLFLGSTKADYIAQAREVLLFSSRLTTADGVTLDISPAHILNNTLGANDGAGHGSNPVTGLAYASNVVLRGDYARVLAEFWADGPNSETPPGHWNVLFNQVSDHPLTTFRFQGQGNALRRLEWDVCGYFALNTAVHDAACAAWTLKREYDSARPITMIRYLAALGQSTDSNQPSYNADGLPLVSGLIELITGSSSAAGQRHAHLAASVGQVAILAWLGSPSSPTQTSGVGWILGANWVPYQRETFVTPAFPGYISGHSTFSRAGAEVLTRFTGNPFFPGGLATYDYPAGAGLTFEAGPAKDVQLQWATYYDAADQAGLSRLHGGIHISADDLTGRKMGAKVSNAAFDRFLQYYGATAVVVAPPLSGNTPPPTPVTPAPAPAPSSGGGGGGAPSPLFLLALLTLSAARGLRRAAGTIP